MKHKTIIYPKSNITPTPNSPYRYSVQIESYVELNAYRESPEGSFSALEEAKNLHKRLQSCFAMRVVDLWGGKILWEKDSE